MTDLPETIWARRALSEHRFGTWEQRRYVHDPSTEYRRADLPRTQDAARIAELEAALRRAHILLAANLGFVNGSAEAAIDELGGFAEAMALAGDFVAADSGAADA